MPKNDASPNEFNIESFKNGDKTTFNKVFSLYFASLMYFAAKITRDTMEAEDIVLVGFKKLWEIPVNFEDLNHIKNFLYITVRNDCFQYLKKQGRTAKNQDDFQYNQQNAYDPFEIDKDAIKASLLNEIYIAIENLPEQQRAVFKLAYFEGMEPGKIAKELNRSLQTVYNQKSTALATLKEKFKDHSVFFFLFMFSLGHCYDKEQDNTLHETIECVSDMTII